MPKHRPNRSFRMVGLLWIMSVLVAGTFATSLGSRTAYGVDPTPEVTLEPTGTPGPTEEPQCSPSGSAGQVPSGTQSISGTVTDGGSPQVGIEVFLAETGGGNVSVSTDSDGAYSFNELGNGNYLLSFHDSSGTFKSGFYDGPSAPLVIDRDQGEIIPLTGVGATGIDVDLDPEALHSISGSVSDSLLGPVDGVQVRAAGAYFGLVGCATTSSGAFTMASVRSGVYIISVSAPGFPAGFYGDGAPGNFTTHPSEATLVAVDTDIAAVDITFPALFTLTGVVRNSLLEPQAGFSISANEIVQGASGSAASDEFGQFTIEGLPAGDYHVSYSDGYQVHRSGWYAGDGIIAATEAGAATVTVDGTGPAIELLAELAPRILGRITNEAAEPVPDIAVSICDADYLCGNGYTDSDGYYFASIVTPGTYYAQVSDGNNAYPSGGFLSAGGGPVVRDLVNAVPIVVGETGDQTGVDGVLPYGGTISVHLTTNGDPLQYPNVVFCRSEFECGDVPAGYDGDGNPHSAVYFVGTYYVREDFDYDGEGRWLVDGGTASADFAEATEIQVVASTETVITSEVPPPPPSCPTADSAGPIPAGTQVLSGFVRDEGGVALGDVVVALTSSAGGRATTLSGADGSYAFESLGSATYWVSAYDQFGNYLGVYHDVGLAVTQADATGVVLAGSGASAVDISMPAEILSTISGTVTHFDGSPVSGVLVSAAGTDFPLIACNFTTVNGTYELTGARGGAYRISVSKSGYPHGFYSSAGFTQTHSAATTVEVLADVGSIDIQFPELHSLNGTVLDELGAAAPLVRVSACETTTLACQSFESDSAGGFQIDGLVAGTYRVSEQDPYNRFLSGYYTGDDGFSQAIGEAATVTVPGSPPIQLLAVAAPHIAGTITNGLGEPLPALSVSACDIDEIECSYGVTNDDGEYTLGITAPGTYYVRVTDNDGIYPAGFIAAGGLITRNVGSALGISVTDTSVDGIDAVLPDAGFVAVTVTSGGDPVQSFVELCIGAFECPDGIGLDEAGSGTSAPLLPDTYYLRAYDVTESASYWYGSGTVASVDFADATPVVVTAGSTTSIAIAIPEAATSTPVGNPILTLDDGSNTNSISMSFANVDPSGITSATATGSGPDVPTGFKLDSAAYYDFSSTAVFDEVQICINYDESGFTAEASMRFFHYDAGTASWEDITDPGYPNVDLNIICGTTDSLSPFVVAERAYTFGGFIGPKSPPKVNEAKAGATIGLQFSLGGDVGLDFFLDGTPTMRQIDCTTGAPMGTEAAATGTLKYNSRSDNYTYGWATLKGWKNTCREVSLSFDNGTSVSLWYRLKA